MMSYTITFLFLACSATCSQASTGGIVRQQSEIDAAGKVASLEPSNHWMEVVHHGACGPKDLFVKQVYNIRECEILCEEHSHCDAISFSSVTHKCEIHTGPLQPTNWDYYKCYQPIPEKIKMPEPCVKNCRVGDFFKGKLGELLARDRDEKVVKKLVGNICRKGNEFYFDGRSIAVGAGKTDEACNSTKVVCAGGGTYGSKKKQARAVYEALENDYVHPDAPDGNIPSTITICPEATTTTPPPETGLNDRQAHTVQGEWVLDLGLSTVEHNNLGGVGPDSGAANLRYKGVGVLADGRSVDLVVSAESPYAKAAPARNGNSGKFGSINVLGGTSVELKFKFESTATGHEVTVPPFFFSVSDLDQGRTMNGFVIGRETLTLRGFKEYYLTKDTEVEIGTMGDGRMTFASTTMGVGSDNPRDPAHLTEQQANRMATFLFEGGLSEFHLEFRVAKANYGRNFAFAGRSAIADTAKPVTTTTTSTPASLPSCVADSPGLALDFFGASLRDNNLGGLGPDEGPADIRYGNVATVSATNAQKVDMIITALGPYSPHNVQLNGKWEGAFGLINLQARDTANTLNLEIKFVDPATDMNVEIEEFDLSFVDIDGGQTSAKESVIIGGFDSYYLSTASTVEVKKLSGGLTEFSSSVFGERSDNPHDPLYLTDSQKAKAVNLHFTKVSMIPLTLKVSKSIWTYGRDFMFAGKSAVKDCGWEYDKEGELKSTVQVVQQAIAEGIAAVVG